MRHERGDPDEHIAMAASDALKALGASVN